MPILVIDHVSKFFGGLAANSDVSFSMEEGTILGLIGPNGAGKTTFFNVITGLYKPDGGSFELAGRPYKPSAVHEVAKQGIARTFQNIRLFPEMTALENVMVGRHVRTHSGLFGAVFRSAGFLAEEAAIRTRAQELLDYVGIGRYGEYRARTLSYGDQRRLEIARAMCTDPRLLCLDEFGPAHIETARAWRAYDIAERIEADWARLRPLLAGKLHVLTGEFDSFYLEGGSSNLEQAIGGYKDFAQYFPTHPLTCAVKLKIAHSHMRQMNAFNRDWTPAKKAELQLKATEISCKNSPLLAQIEQNLIEVQQILGLHERDIALFYMDNRKAYKAAEGRLRDIVNNYPKFSYRDEAIYKLGVALIEQEQPEEASQYFTELLKKFPQSEFAGEAKKYLDKLGKPIPEPDADATVPERPGRVGRMKLVLGWNDLAISKDGVLVSREGDTKADEAEKLQKPIEAVGGVGSVRASTKGPGTAPVPTTAPSTNALTSNVRSCGGPISSVTL